MFEKNNIETVIQEKLFQRIRAMNREGVEFDPQDSDPLSSRMSHRFMFAEFLGSMFYGLISQGCVITSGVLTFQFTYKGLTPGMLVTLGEQKILNLEDFADLASDELTGGFDIVKGERVKIQGYLEDFALSKNEADELIMSARNKIYKD